MSTPYIALQPSEQTLLQAAAQIYAAYVISGQATVDRDEEMLAKSIQQAIQLAQGIDAAVQADKEVS